MGLEPTRELPQAVFETAAARPKLGLRFHDRARRERDSNSRGFPQLPFQGSAIAARRPLHAGPGLRCTQGGSLPGPERRAEYSKLTAGAAHSSAARPGTLAGSLSMVREGRFELPRPCGHTGLSRACMPIPTTRALIIRLHRADSAPVQASSVATRLLGQEERGTDESGWRELNPRHSPWEGDVLPLNYNRMPTTVFRSLVNVPAPPRVERQVRLRSPENGDCRRLARPC